MAIKKSELEQKWYFRGSKVFFWAFQIVVLIAMISQGKGNLLDIIMGFALYSLILIGLWRLFLYVAFGGVENDKLNKNNIEETK